jgi:ribosomal protein L44E
MSGVEYLTSIQRLVDEGRSLHLTCWRFGRKSGMSGTNMAARAKPDEGQNRFIIRLKCARCGAKSPQADVI